MNRIAIVGAKNSGKTTLIEKLLPLLNAAGLKVASTKHTAHEHKFDTSGKDTWRHRQAGAGMTLAIGQTDLALFAPLDKSLVDELNSIIESRFDLCIIEGDKWSTVPKILLTRNLEQLDSKEITGIVGSYGQSRFNERLPHFYVDQIDKVCQFLQSVRSGATSGDYSHA